VKGGWGSGVAACAFENDLEALARTREFFDFLPLSNREDPPTRVTDDPVYVPGTAVQSILLCVCVHQPTAIATVGSVLL
jgi:acetyl-CoA carboxylase carboxyltransferase component